MDIRRDIIDEDLSQEPKIVKISSVLRKGGLRCDWSPYQLEYTFQWDDIEERMKIRDNEVEDFFPDLSIEDIQIMVEKFLSENVVKWENQTFVQFRGRMGTFTQGHMVGDYYNTLFYGYNSQQEVIAELIELKSQYDVRDIISNGCQAFYQESDPGVMERPYLMCRKPIVEGNSRYCSYHQNQYLHWQKSMLKHRLTEDDIPQKRVKKIIDYDDY